MVNYECYRCGYTNNNKSNIIRHINRKNTCKVSFLDIKLDDCKKEILSGMSYKDYCGKCSVDEMDQNIPKYPHFGEEISPKYPQNIPKNEQKLTEISKCYYCQKNLSSYKNLRRHLKTCKEKKKDDTVRESMTELARLLNEKEEQLKEQMLLVNKELKNREEYEKKLEKKEKEHQKQISELIKKAGIATTNNNNITNNIQNNIKLLNYKDTDISDLTENDYVKCLEHYNFCVPHLIRRIHFNPKKPENHNVYISNLKNSYIMIYMNNKWKVKNRDETISSMIDDKQILFEKKIQEWVKSGNKYPKLMAKFSRYIEKREQNDVINAIKEDIKLMLYNNRNMILENKKLLK